MDNLNKPIYLQIAEGLEDDIQAGRYRSDSRLPSVRDAAAQFQVNVNTAMRAFEQLERQEVIYNRRGIGYFVSPRARELITARRKEQFFRTDLKYFFSRIRQIGLSAEELTELYNEFLGRQ